MWGLAPTKIENFSVHVCGVSRVILIRVSESSDYRQMSKRSANVCVLLRSNVRFLNTTRRSCRPSSRVRGTTVAVIEYSCSSSLLNKYGSSSSTGVSGTACDLVRVTDGRGTPLVKYPHALRAALLGAASARTNEKMAREFFTTLKRVGSVALVEVVAAPKKCAAPASASPKRASVVQAEPPTEPEVDPLEALKAEMAEQDDWDAETDEERASREKKEKKERKKRSLERWVARRASERMEASEYTAATRLAAMWRGHASRQSVSDLKAMIAEAESPTHEEEDDESQIQEWQESSGVQGPCAQDMDEWDDYPFEDDDPWDEEDRYEREWEEHRADARLAMWT